MKTNTKKSTIGASTETVVLEKSINYPHEALLEALYFFWDAFERSNLYFFLIRDTAKQVIANRELEGDKLTLGLRRMEWQGGGDRIFNSMIQHEKVEVEKHDDYILFHFKNIPVYLYLYDENPTLSSFDSVFYQMESFNTPNPFKEFDEKYDY